LKVAVSAATGSLDAQTDPRFGRSQYFLIIDPETMKFEAIPNTAAGAMGGAGIQAAQTIASKSVEALITGNVGPNAFQALSTAGMKIVTGVSGTVKEVVERYKRGELKGETSAPTVRGHFGLGRARGRGEGGKGKGDS